MTEAIAALDGWRASYGRIGSLLFENLLEPTPENYALAHRYLESDDPDFRNLVEGAIRHSGRLTPAAVAGILVQRNAELSSTDLSRIADEAQDFLEQLTGLVGRSSDDAESYGAALSSEAADLAAGAPPLRTVGSLIELTRSMIDKTRAAEEHLRRTGAEIRALRNELAATSHSANSDALTDLPNRRAMDLRLRAAIEFSSRTGQPLSIAIFDIDNFKGFNDLHGHQIGDEVLKFVAAALARSSGDHGYAARYGGEEFVLLFEGLDATAAAVQADRIRAELAGREMRVTASGRPLGKITLSAGIAAIAQGDAPASLLKRADAALYRAKHLGRNRVCVA